ncbi:Protein of unknown function (DUF506) [Quillaja saponaria]|uniref:Uncharacterized protein n=1 Tax=Quillaja saponaria TaxID=32244 RepID=A0AAD7L202_QUISA|nr:Protein of unknown function (DUF506) [Quillaja saponaria]
MGNFLEEKALGGAISTPQKCKNSLSLEHNVSVFLGDDYSNDANDHESDGNDSHNSAQRTLYWESQEALLQEILELYIQTGSKLREEFGRVIEVVKASDFCHCLKPNSAHGCSYCLRRGVVTLLCDKGFRAILRTSKWRNTRKLPGGSHEYIEVIASTSIKKKQIPYLIELEFRDQFQMVRASDEYQKLITQLPEFYIGKPDYLTAIVRIVCDAAKRSMEEKKIHMGPWRKSGFMQMKCCFCCGSHLKFLLETEKQHPSKFITFLLG